MLAAEGKDSIEDQAFGRVSCFLDCRNYERCIPFEDRMKQHFEAFERCFPYCRMSMGWQQRLVWGRGCGYRHQHFENRGYLRVSWQWGRAPMDLKPYLDMDLETIARAVGPSNYCPWDLDGSHGGKRQRVQSDIIRLCSSSNKMKQTIRLTRNKAIKECARYTGTT